MKGNEQLKIALLGRDYKRARGAGAGASGAGAGAGAQTGRKGSKPRRLRAGRDGDGGSDDDDGGGRSSLGRAKLGAGKGKGKGKGKRKGGRVVGDGGGDEGEDEVEDGDEDGDGVEDEVDGVLHAEKIAIYGAKTRVQAPKRASNYLDEVLAERSRKRRKKKDGDVKS